jgi:hypothetical protein
LKEIRMKVVYNYPSLKDISIIDGDVKDYLVYTLPAATREALPQGDVAVDADTNGNVTITDKNDPANTLYTTVPVGADSPVTTGAALLAALQNANVPTVIINGDITLPSLCTVAGYKKILGTGTITVAAAGIAISEDSILVLGENIVLDCTSVTAAASVLGLIHQCPGSTVIDKATGTILSSGTIRVEYGATNAKIANVNVTAGYATVTAEGYAVDGGCELKTAAEELLNAFGLSAEGTLTIKAGQNFTIGDGANLSIANGKFVGSDGTSKITLDPGGTISGTVYCGLKPEVLAAGETIVAKEYTWDATLGIWTSEE